MEVAKLAAPPNLEVRFVSCNESAIKRWLSSELEETVFSLTHELFMAKHHTVTLRCGRALKYNKKTAVYDATMIMIKHFPFRLVYGIGGVLLVVKWAWLITLLKFIKMCLMAGACGTILFLYLLSIKLVDSATFYGVASAA